MEIVKIPNKRKYMDLLLIADESASMIDKYVDVGDMYGVRINGQIIGVAVVCDVGGGIVELKNLAILFDHRRKGYGRKLIEHICNMYKDRYDILQAGTGDSPLTVPFYENCGFYRSHIMKNFFTDNYDHPIYEGGVLLSDMVYFRKRLR